jgi:pyruvate,water dikinase
MSNPVTAPEPMILWFSEIALSDLPEVGGKNASLGEMTSTLKPLGVGVPDGFAVTTSGYRLFLSQQGLRETIQTLLSQLPPPNYTPNDTAQGSHDRPSLETLRKTGSALRAAVLATPLPLPLKEAIAAAYERLRGEAPEPPDVAVRSSATAEDLPDASFAGAQETFLHVRGVESVLNAVHRCFASLFNDRAISYRIDQGFAQEKIALSVGIQQMVRSDLACSGVMFTLDPETGFRNVVTLSAVYGLGESLVQGTVTPDEFVVFKPALHAGNYSLLQKRIGSKESRMVYDGKIGGTCTVPVPDQARLQATLSDEEVQRLARWACLTEEHYSRKLGHPMPMDIEWAKDGITGELFLLQARPETVHSRRQPYLLETHQLAGHGPVLASGCAVGSRVATGRVRVIESVVRMGEFQEGEVLVTDRTDPDWQPIMRKAAAILTNRGGRTCHAAIVSRELGVPAVVGTGNVTEVLRDGQLVTVSCAEGETGFVYEGSVPFKVQHTDLRKLSRPKTQMLLNLADPGQAFALSFLPCDGVGLARMEFIISRSIRIHPLALTDFQRVTDPVERAEIERLTANYPEKPLYFIEELARGVAMIAAAFHPRPVLLRLSDFKTNEYAHLVGGQAFEPVEENPMLGFRGASRYAHPRYKSGFALECRAIRKVREEMGLTNLRIMIPFCRTIAEAHAVHAELAAHGLARGTHGLQIFMMCEVPSNVVLAEQFADLFDGFSIGSNDLTQLVLGVDRDSEIVSSAFDERNEAVQRMITHAIHVCRRKGVKIGICGQAPSDYPEFAQFLVHQRIDSISLNPDTVISTVQAVLEAESVLRAEQGPELPWPSPSNTTSEPMQKAMDYCSNTPTRESALHRPTESSAEDDFAEIEMYRVGAKPLAGEPSKR